MIFFAWGIIKAISQCGEDGWLGTLHCLMQMDDTAVLATSRNSLINKLRKLKCCSDNIDQSMHPIKSKFFTVNTNDREPITLDNVVISHVDSYVYLGTPMSNSPPEPPSTEPSETQNRSHHQIHIFLGKEQGRSLPRKRNSMAQRSEFLNHVHR